MRFLASLRSDGLRLGARSAYNCGVVQERTLQRPDSCGDNLKSLFREKVFLPGLLAENRDGNGSLPRSRNLISEKVFTRPSTLYGRGRADIHHGPESVTPPKAEYIGADQLPLIIFRLQLCGGPYIPRRTCQLNRSMQLGTDHHNLRTTACDKTTNI